MPERAKGAAAMIPSQWLPWVFVVVAVVAVSFIGGTAVGAVENAASICKKAGWDGGEGSYKCYREWREEDTYHRKVTAIVDLMGRP